MKYLLFFISISTTLQFDHFFNGNNRILPSIIIVFFSTIYLVLMFSKMRKLNARSMLMILIGFLLSVFYMIVWIDVADTPLLLTTLLTFIPIFTIIGIVSDAVPKLDKKSQVFIFEQTINFAIIALLIECYFRITNPFLSLPQDIDIVSLDHQLQNLNIETFFTDGFYVYKSSSVTFFDSNYVGVFALFILVYLFFAKSFFLETKKKYDVRIFIVFSLIILSFSRASIAAALILIAVEMFYYCKGRSTLVLSLYITTVSFLVLIVFLFIIDYIINDPSFHTKLDTVSSLVKATEIPIPRLLFGYGFNIGSSFYSHQPGAYAHAATPLLFGIVGLSGLFLFYGVLSYYAIKLGRPGFHIMIVILVNGFSILDPWQIFFYWGVAYMYAMKVISPSVRCNYRTAYV